MKTKHLIFALGLALLGVMPASAATARTWTDTQGRKVEATFIKLDGETVYIQLANGSMFPLPLNRLIPEDQALVKTLPPADNASALISVPTNASVAQAAAKIDQLVVMGLQKGNIKLAESHRKQLAEDAKSGKKTPAPAPLKQNPFLTDEQFVRRVYVDIAGRIPNYDEASAFLKDGASDKRARLIDKLLESDGYASNTFNYFAEMLRMRSGDTIPYVNGKPYVEWMKDQIRANQPWDKIVYEMITADGKVWNNGAAGYLIRDAGMPLDNLANTLSVFLGTDVSCAQCHDHPFSDWTQRQFYEMAAFFGTTITYTGDREFGSAGYPAPRLIEEAVKILDKNGVNLPGGNAQNRYLRQTEAMRRIMNANRYVISEVSTNRMRLPRDYKYKDGAPGEPVAPKLIMWGEADKKNPAYALIERAAAKKNSDNDKKDLTVESDVEGLRAKFGKWMTHPANPRFAMTIANRMWSRAFGLALTPSVRNLDNPEEAYNPELLKHLTAEMVRVKFNLKEFMRILYNTKTYQSESTLADIAMGEPYYFQGPVLRRMTAEQAWDSYMTLVLGNPDTIKNTEADLYGRSIDMNLHTVDVQTMLQKINAVLTIADKQGAKMGGGLAMAGGEGMMDDKKMNQESTGGMMDGKILSYGTMKLMRASELDQPAEGSHFLRAFGQSERSVIDGGSTEGSVPQVLMMMNGKAQEMLTNKDSLIFRNMEKVTSPAEKVEAIFLSILSRRPTLQEKDIAKKQLGSNGEGGYANIIWALINTREFSFIQ